ncbi:hypothetical protein [Pseudonocardia zijingensis]|jgi:hypothetical protein|uniref:Uncharacterized protein n=1 Tax=Pseudonocardia zijingensis TaxID=153376 RepID=A0ABN1NHH0_9PSEU
MIAELARSRVENARSCADFVIMPPARGLLMAPRIVRGRPSQVKGASGVAARSLRAPWPGSLCGPYGRLRGQAWGLPFGARGATRRLRPLEVGETADLRAIKGKWSLLKII